MQPVVGHTLQPVVGHTLQPVVATHCSLHFYGQLYEGFNTCYRACHIQLYYYINAVDLRIVKVGTWPYVRVVNIMPY